MDILKFEAKSTSETGVYSCKAVDTSAKTAGEPARAKVLVSALEDQPLVEITASGHTLTPFERVIRAKQSDNLILNCGIRNLENLAQPIMMKWLKSDTKREFSPRKDVIEYNLSLENLDSNHAGKYYCVAIYGPENVQIFDYVEVEVDRYIF